MSGEIKTGSQLKVRVKADVNVGVPSDAKIGGGADLIYSKILSKDLTLNVGGGFTLTTPVAGPKWNASTLSLADQNAGVTSREYKEMFDISVGLRFSALFNLGGKAGLGPYLNIDYNPIKLSNTGVRPSPEEIAKGLCNGPEGGGIFDGDIAPGGCDPIPPPRAWPRELV